jgi:hypothetical protein
MGGTENEEVNEFIDDYAIFRCAHCSTIKKVKIIGRKIIEPEKCEKCQFEAFILMEKHFQGKREITILSKDGPLIVTNENGKLGLKKK